MIDRLAAVEQKYEEIQGKLADPEISGEYSRIGGLTKELAAMKDVADLARKYRQLIEEINDVRSLILEEYESDIEDMAKEELAELEAQKVRLEKELQAALLPKDPNDQKNVIMEIRAGTGGEEAGLFASELFRMYSYYAQRMKWKTEVIDATQTGIGAIREITFQVRGSGAYSRLKHESGVHRVQRIPVTESSGRIHTSAATVAVLPEAQEVDVQIHSDDLNIDIFHASGHGGQNVQKVATAVRITHIPTGVTATCQDERSQFKNKEKALSVLRSRILAAEIEKQQREVTENRRSQVGSGDRSERVRTYNYPQGRVTDHRIDLTSYNLEQVLNGELTQFIDALMQEEQVARMASSSM